MEDFQTAEANLKIAQARVQSLTAQIEGAASRLKGSEAKLGHTRIYAPMSGTVVTLDAREGQTLNAAYQTPVVMRIADLSRMTVWAEVSEADIGRVKVDMPVYFTTMGLMDAQGQPRRWESTLRQVLPAPPNKPVTAAAGAGAQEGAQPASGKVVAYTALFDVDNADGALMPQMTARVFFVSAAASHALVVPLAALKPTADRNTFEAQVLENGSQRQRTVKVGVRDRLQAEVVSGLNGLADAGHTVILITHDQKVADQARRVVRIHDGRVVEDSGECVPPPVLSHPLGKAGKTEAAEQAVMAGKTVTAGQSVTAGKAATAGQTVTAGQTSTAGQTRTAGQTMTGGAAGSAGSPKPASSSASSIEATVRRLRRAARTPVSWWRGPRPVAVRCTPGHAASSGKATRPPGGRDASWVMSRETAVS